jgi:hypothetical protein
MQQPKPRRTRRKIVKGPYKRPVARMPPIDKVIEVIYAERGILVEIARALGVSRTVIRSFAADRPNVAEALKEAREAMGDVAEKKLYELIEAGDVRCITYYLSTAHRHRGYGIRKDESADMFTDKTSFVQTINVIAVPSGQFLPASEARSMMAASSADYRSSGPSSNGSDMIDVDVAPAADPPAPPAPTASCLE